MEPTEDSIQMLVSMGFDQDSARQALVQARNDVNVATNILLEAQSHWISWVVLILESEGAVSMVYRLLLVAKVAEVP